MTVTGDPTPMSHVTWLAEPDDGAVADFDPMAHWHETLGDGTRVLIRPIGKEDAALERTFIERLSPASRWYRFLGQMNASDDMIKRLTDIDYRREMAFIALRHEAGEKREIGVSRFCISDDGASCECAVAVSDEWQGRGLGHLLMRHLIEVARRRGIKRMFSIDSAGNQRMRVLATSLGFERNVEPGYPSQVIHSLAL
jgi:GNAT superfamily N-acetyltransferase